jgi:hypothetical protein
VSTRIWRIARFAGGESKRRTTECVWMNYAPPVLAADLFARRKASPRAKSVASSFTCIHILLPYIPKANLVPLWKDGVPDEAIRLARHLQALRTHLAAADVHRSEAVCGMPKPVLGQAANKVSERGQVMSDNPDTRKRLDDMKAGITKRLRELEWCATNAMAATGSDVLTLRNEFLDRAAVCRQQGETEKAEV